MGTAAILHLRLRPKLSLQARKPGRYQIRSIYWQRCQVGQKETTVMPKDALTITDHRTDKTYELPIEHETIRAMDLRKIKVNPDDFGLMTYDPALMNTADCKSAITYIDGDKGILRYRGYDIDDLAENCTYLQVAYLLLHGELPNPEREAEWVHDITFHTMLHETTKKFIDGFRYDAHPMGIFVSTLAALSTCIRRRGTFATDEPGSARLSA